MTTVARLLAWRDKRISGSASASASAPTPPVFTTPTSRPSSWSGDLAAIFLLPPELQKKKSEKEKDKEPDTKIRTILGQLVISHATIFKEAHVEYALQSVEPLGDSHAAFDLLMTVHDSIKGIIRPIKPSIKLVGAENRDYVTCYLDSLLFAMFAQMDCFDPMLQVSEHKDRSHTQLAQLLRLWVNMLRSGHLITKNITRHLQEALAGCGWADARLLAQQDVSESFAFITEAMGLPLLTLKVELFHTGKESRDDDHKLVNERLLDVAIPPVPEDGSSISLESCLEAYFNSRVEIKRILQRRHTLRSVRSMDSDKDTSAGHFAADIPELGLSPISTAIPPVSPFSSFSPLKSLYNKSTQQPSIFRPDGDPSPTTVSQPKPRTRDDLDIPTIPRSNSKHKREVLMPAWQFFQLLPWFPNHKPKSDAQVAEHFKLDRPVLGICLKRYYLSPQGEPGRLETKIDIPLEFSLPHFVSETNQSSSETATPLFTRFKLSLEAIICHRGKSIDAGHYISLVRPRARYCLPSHGGEASDLKWFVFDDLNQASRVRVVDIYEALEHELPYLLFYRVVPMNGDVEVENPPSYGEATSSSAIQVDDPTIGLGASRSITPTPDGMTIAAATTPSWTSNDARSQISFSSLSFGGNKAGPSLPSTSPFLPPQFPSRTPSYSRINRLSLDDRNANNSGSTSASAATTPSFQTSAPPTADDSLRPRTFFSLRYSKKKKNGDSREKESKDAKDERKDEKRDGKMRADNNDRDSADKVEAPATANTRQEKTLSSFFGRQSLPLSSSKSSGQLSSLISPRFFSRSSYTNQGSEKSNAGGGLSSSCIPSSSSGHTSSSTTNANSNGGDITPHPHPHQVNGTSTKNINSSTPPSSGARSPSIPSVSETSASVSSEKRKSGSDLSGVIVDVDISDGAGADIENGITALPSFFGRGSFGAGSGRFMNGNGYGNTLTSGTSTGVSTTATTAPTPTTITICTPTDTASSSSSSCPSTQPDGGTGASTRTAGVTASGVPAVESSSIWRSRGRFKNKGKDKEKEKDKETDKEGANGMAAGESERRGKSKDWDRLRIRSKSWAKQANDEDGTKGPPDRECLVM